MSQSKRPTDVIGNAIRVAQIATGEVQEEYDAEPEKPAKDEAAAARGRKGEAAQAKAMTSERRAEIARKAASKGWEAPNKGTCVMSQIASSNDAVKWDMPHEGSIPRRPA